MSHQFPMSIIVREVAKSDATGIAQNISLRPQSEIDYTTKLISQEIEALETNPNSKIFVACVNNEVVGFARCSYISSTSDGKFPSPPGWYGLGIIVNKSFRKQGVARALSSYRLQWLKSMGVEYFYSFTNSENLVSLQMHKAFGFEKVMTSSGFLTVNYTTGTGVLFRIKV